MAEKTRTVEMLTTYAGPEGTCDAGGLIDLPEKQAKDFVKSGFAKYATRPVRGKQKASAKKRGRGKGKGRVERATRRPAENALGPSASESKRGGDSRPTQDEGDAD